MNTTSDPSLACLPALLGFVRREPSYGYEIYRRLGRPELRAIWRLKQSRLYAMLARLEGAGYLRTTLEPQAGRPPRKVFHLTEAGAAAFQAWLEQPVANPRDMRLEFMLKLYFALEGGGGEGARLVARQRAVCAGWLREQRVVGDGPFARAVIAYRQAHIRAIADWLDELRL